MRNCKRCGKPMDEASGFRSSELADIINLKTRKVEDEITVHFKKGGRTVYAKTKVMPPKAIELKNGNRYQWNDINDDVGPVSGGYWSYSII